MADIRYITIPASINFSIQLKKDAEFIPWSFEKCVGWIVEREKRFNTDGEGARAGQRVLDAMNAPQRIHNKGAILRVFHLDEADWKRLHDAMEQPDCGWIFPLEMGPLSARTFIPYMNAVNDENTRRKPRSDAKEAARAAKRVAKENKTTPAKPEKKAT